MCKYNPPKWRIPEMRQIFMVWNQCTYKAAVATEKHILVTVTVTVTVTGSEELCFHHHDFPCFWF
jgi:hypothetical protein